MIGTSIWVYFDAKTIGVRKGQLSGFVDMGRWGWFLACLLIWIVGFPLYLSKRDVYRRINAGEGGTAGKCPDCGHEMPAGGEICLTCGAAPAQKKTGLLGYVLPGVLILVIFGVVASMFSAGPGSSGTGFISVSEPVVTYNEYLSIENGMSYQQVVSIIGEPGREISRNKTDGVPGVMEDIETVMYEWANSDGSNMNAMFQNDRLIQKAQFWLD